MGRTCIGTYIGTMSTDSAVMPHALRVQIALAAVGGQRLRELEQSGFAQPGGGHSSSVCRVSCQPDAHTPYWSILVRLSATRHATLRSELLCTTVTSPTACAAALLTSSETRPTFGDPHRPS